MTVVFAVIFFLPGVRLWGLRVKRWVWNFAGLVAALAYIALAISFHQAAMARIQKFAAVQQLDVQTIGALPMPPSPWHWDGLVRATRGVYETRIDLGGSSRKRRSREFECRASIGISLLSRCAFEFLHRIR